MNYNMTIMDRKSFLQNSFMGSSGFMLSGGLAFNPADTYSRPTDLKITDIRGATVAANYDYPIIKIYTNQGIEGLGEVRDAGWISQALMLKPFLVGRDPLNIYAILDSIKHLTGHGRYGGGYSAVDIALMDIIGKALDKPCWQLLGEKYRDEIPVYADTFAADNPDNQAELMKRRLEKGFQHYKTDLRPVMLRGIEGAIAGGLPTAKGLEIWGEYVEKVRDVIGYRVKLGADHFGPMTIETGIALGKYMADSRFALAYIEDVVHYANFNTINLNKAITLGSPVPTLGFEDIFGFEGFRPFIEQAAVSIIHPDMLTSGGMIETKKIADYARQFGVETMMHCACSPIGTMAMVHTCATIKEFISLENHALEMPWWQDLVTGIHKPIIEQGGVIRVPDSPGLGIEIDDDVLQKHLRESKYLTYDPGFFNPTPMFDKPMTMQEARARQLIGGYKVAGPWWHINEEGVYANQDSPDQR